jgi:hypothetical protein
MHTDELQRVEADGQLLRSSAKRTNTTQAANSEPQRCPQGDRLDTGVYCLAGGQTATTGRARAFFTGLGFKG